MSDEKRSYLVAYDINDDRRRDHVAKILRRYGERLQYSVFFLRIRPAKMLVVQNLIEVAFRCLVWVSGSGGVVVLVG